MEGHATPLVTVPRVALDQTPLSDAQKQPCNSLAGVGWAIGPPRGSEPLDWRTRKGPSHDGGGPGGGGFCELRRCVPGLIVRGGVDGERTEATERPVREPATGALVVVLEVVRSALVGVAVGRDAALRGGHDTNHRPDATATQYPIGMMLHATRRHGYRLPRAHSEEHCSHMAHIWGDMGCNHGPRGHESAQTHTPGRGSMGPSAGLVTLAA